jgi:hypothetical protein
MEQTVEMFGYGALPSFWWRSTKFVWSPSYRQNSYEDQAEFILVSDNPDDEMTGQLTEQQSAYETASRLDSVGHHDPAVSDIIDEILEIQDDPKYAECNKETYAHVQDLGKRYVLAIQTYLKEQPDQHIERIRRSTIALYGLTNSTGRYMYSVLSISLRCTW